MLEIFTLWMNNPSKKHYHIVVADIESNGIVVLAFISSIKIGFDFDDACILKEGDLPIIHHDT